MQRQYGVTLGSHLKPCNRQSHARGRVSRHCISLANEYAAGHGDSAILFPGAAQLGSPGG